MSSARLLTDRALVVPRRLAPLSALAGELRRPGAWVDVCRVAALREPEWLTDRLADDDLLVALLAGEGGAAQRDAERARAVCQLALATSGKADERAALRRAAEAIWEPDAPADLAGLSASETPLLDDLVADLRTRRESPRVGRARTIVVDERGLAAKGAAVVVSPTGRAPGLRPDISMRLFAPEDELAAVLATLSIPDGRTALARVEDDAGRPASGGAYAAALQAAVWAATARVPQSGRLIVGAFGPQADTRPSADEITAVLGHAPERDRPLIVGETMPSPRALRRALTRRRTRTRALGAAGAAAVAGAVAVLASGGDVREDVDSGRLAARAEALVTSDLVAAAQRAAEALSVKRDDRTVHAALAVSARARLVLTSGQDAGRLQAVAINDKGIVTTVSTAGRATRWKVEGDRVRAIGAVRIARDERVLALSRAGRWLLMTGPMSDKVNLIDTEGRTPIRPIAVPESLAADDSDQIVALGDGREPAFAVADPGTGLTITRGETMYRVETDERVTALGFSPDGKQLGIGLASSHQLLVDGHSGALRDGSREQFPRSFAVDPVTHVDVQDDGTTLSQGEMSLGRGSIGPLWRWRSGAEMHAVRSVRSSQRDRIVLAGRGLVLVPGERGIEIQQEGGAHDRAALADVVQVPVDGRAFRPLAAAPRLGLAVVASRGGRFSVLDLRRVLPLEGGAVPSSVSVRDGKAAALVGTSTALRLHRWDLAGGRRPTTAPPITGGFADTSQDGRRIVIADERSVRVLDSASGKVVATLRGRGGQRWGTVAIDGDGDTAAAVDLATRRVTVWRGARAIRRTEAAPPSRSQFPAPLALAPDGEHVVHGTGTKLFISDVRDGRARELRAPGEVIRARFGHEARLAVAGSEGVVAFAAPDWRTAARISRDAAYDAVPLRDGVALATAEGLVLKTPAGADVPLPTSNDGRGTRPGTILARGPSPSIVPSVGDLPLVIAHAPSSDIRRLCRIAGRDVTESGCAERAKLPVVTDAPGGGDASSEGLLTVEGFGPLRFGERLPPHFERLPGYGSTGCTVRSLPGLAAAVVTHDRRVESIALFPSTYAPAGAGFDAAQSVGTDLGAFASGMPIRDTYGPPSRHEGARDVWDLRRPDGEWMELRAARRPPAPLPVEIAVKGAECVVWR